MREKLTVFPFIEVTPVDLQPVKTDQRSITYIGCDPGRGGDYTARAVIDEHGNFHLLDGQDHSRLQDDITGFVPLPKRALAVRTIPPFPLAAYRALIA